MDYNKCTIELTDSCIVVKENRSKLELKNPQRKKIKKVKVDGCLISDDKEKCDWIISLDKPEPKLRALYIELKGCDVEKAINQLKSTICQTKEKYHKHDKECYVITTRYPRHDSTTRQFILDMKKNYDASLYIKNILISVEI